MSAPPPLCCATDSGRRRKVRLQALNGIDYVEVSPDQTELTVTFLGRAPDWIERRHVSIEGGLRERDIRVTDLRIESGEHEGIDDRMLVTVDRPGDYSTYRLCILGRDEAGNPLRSPPDDFDPRYACIDFSFKASCGGDADCAEPPSCPPPDLAEPAVDYLARDYASFRRLMLDRLALTLPDWCERHAPDMMITLVELLAYVGDHLSYRQDAVGAEAFLDTARKRASVARHARLVGYRLHEGSNARTWIALEVSEPELELDSADLFFVTALRQGPPGSMLKAEALDEDWLRHAVAFEPRLAEGGTRFTVRKARNRIHFHDWGADECCLPAGATSATLRDPGVIPEPEAEEPAYCAGYAPPPRVRRDVADGSWHELGLAPGDVLVFEERLGPRTGLAADADPARRHAVRLTRATPSLDPVTGVLLYEIEWCVEDALPFPLCLSAKRDRPHCDLIRDVSIAWGNVLLADAGFGAGEPLGEVPIRSVVLRCADECDAAEERRIAGRYRPKLSRRGLTFASPSPTAVPAEDGCGAAAASAALDQDPRLCRAEIVLHGRPPSGGPERRWRPVPDLLGSGPQDRHFVVEMDEDGVAWLRFGDGVNGRAPEAGERFRATFRTGAGPAGNVAAGAIGQIVFRNNFPDGLSLTARNPLPARGGLPPEPVNRARLRAPHQFRRRLERAVAPMDYAEIVMRDFPALVQRSTARMRASGAAVEIEVAVDAFGGEPDPGLLRRLERHLRRYRRIGDDVRVIPARVVPLLLELTVCVKPPYLRGHVRSALQRVLGAGTWPGGRGFFHPDSMSFGDRIAISRIAAAAHRVEGVASVVVTRLERLGEGSRFAFQGDGSAQEELAVGELVLGPFEIGRLDNDPRFPEQGALRLNLRGGR